MGANFDVHSYRGKLEGQLERIRSAPIEDGLVQYQTRRGNTYRFTQKSREILLEFVRTGFLEGLSKARQLKLLEVTIRIAHILGKDLDSATRQDIERLMETIHSREDYSAWTKQSYRAIAKKLYKWLRKTEDSYPDEVRWIKVTIPKQERTALKEPATMFTEEDILKAIEHCKSSRDRAIVAVLWDTGMRVGELLNMQISSVTFDQKGLGLAVISGKTGQRNLRLIFSAPYVRNWLQDHPCRDTQEAPLWINYSTNWKSKNEAIKYPAARKMLKDVFKRAGINKPSNPHNWRHSRATFVSDHLSDSQMSSQFGWIKGSNMLHVYNHAKDATRAMEQMYGLVKEEEMEAQAKPQRCVRCKELNETTVDYCKRCGTALKMDTLLKENEMAKMSEQLMAMQQAIVQKVEEQVLARLGQTNPLNIPEPQQVQPMPGMAAMVSVSGTQVTVGDVQQFYPRMEYYEQHPSESSGGWLNVKKKNEIQ